MSKKILMVCLGNICRSPLAEGILKSKVSNKNIIVDSAGTAAYHIGKSPDKRSIDIAEQHNIDISLQKARELSVNDLDDFDLIYAMDKTNFDNIISLAETDLQHNKVRMIMNEVYPNENIDVPDPYYGGDKGFHDVYKMLDKATDKIVDKIL